MGGEVRPFECFRDVFGLDCGLDYVQDCAVAGVQDFVAEHGQGPCQEELGFFSQVVS